MCVHHAAKLVTSNNGLAFNCRSSASPYHTNGDWVASAAGQCPCAAAGGLPEHPQPRHYLPSGRRRGGHPSHTVRLARVAAGRPHPHQQPLEEQNGQRDTETARQRRGVHHAGAPDRPGDSGNRVLAVGQLLVAGSGGSRGDRGLTNGQAAPYSRHARQRGLVDDVVVAAVLAGQRLAPGGALRRRLLQPLTPRALRPPHAGGGPLSPAPRRQRACV